MINNALIVEQRHPIHFVYHIVFEIKIIILSSKRRRSVADLFLVLFFNISLMIQLVQSARSGHILITNFLFLKK